MEIHKAIARQLIWKILGRSVHGIEAVPVLEGPLKGKLLPKDAAMEQLSMLFGRYEPSVVSEILRLPETTRIAYDVGAHIGYISLVLAHTMSNGGKVFAFEPLSSNVEILTKLTALNHIEGRVKVLPLAFGDTIGEQKFVMWGSSMMHLLEGAEDGQDTSQCDSIMVGVSTIDSFVFEQSNPPPDLIKIDVEGAEVSALKGSLRTLSTYSPSIILEIHGPTNALGVWELLDTLNYQWMELTQEGRSAVTTKERLLSYFSKDHWTHHFSLTHG